MKKITQQEYDEAIKVVKQFEKSCSKCGGQIPDTWEGSANSFDIHFDIDCQSIHALWGEDVNTIGFKHPAIKEASNYQGLTLQARKGTKYQLCPSCNRKLIRIIGDFIK